MITHRQAALLLFIKAEIDRRGIAPSYDEMAVATGNKSKSNIHRLVLELEARGKIRRLPSKARAIEITAPFAPEFSAADQGAIQSALAVAMHLCVGPEYEDLQKRWASIYDRMQASLQKLVA